VPITTPVASPESNGMAEAFVNTMRRDYVEGADLSSGERVIEQLAAWIEDYNGFAPHSALGDRSPAEYRRELVDTPSRRCSPVVARTHWLCVSLLTPSRSR